MKTLRPLIILAIFAWWVSLAHSQVVGGPSAPCPSSAIINSDTSAGALQAIAAPVGGGRPVFTDAGGINPPTIIGGFAIHICSVEMMVVQTGTPSSFGLVTGTGANCATGTANLTPQWAGTASVKDTKTTVYTRDAALAAPANAAVCLNLSATPTSAQLLVTYIVY